MIDTYRAAVRACRDPAGLERNNQVGVFTFVHVAESEREAIDSGAPQAALWYVSSAPRVFNVPRDIFYAAIRGTTDPRSQGSIAALKQADVSDADGVDGGSRTRPAH